MCDQSMLDDVSDVISDFVNNGDMFTAHDVTIECRSRYNSKSMPHYEVRQAVSILFNQNVMGVDYSRDTIVLNMPDGSTVQALVYFPLSKNISNYDSNWLRNKYSGDTKLVDPSNVVPVPALVNPSNTVTPVSIASNVNSYSVDHRGRLCIRRTDIDAIGACPGQVLHLLMVNSAKGSILTPFLHLVTGNNTSSNIVILTSSKSLLGSTFVVKGNYLVDCYGNVRIGRNTLNKCGLGNGNYFTVNCSGSDYLTIS